MLEHASLGDSKPSQAWPVTDHENTFKIAPEFLSTFLYADKAYKVQEKDDPVSRRWKRGMTQIHSQAGQSSIPNNDGCLSSASIAANAAERERAQLKNQDAASESQRRPNPAAEQQKPLGPF